MPYAEWHIAQEKDGIGNAEEFVVYILGRSKNGIDDTDSHHTDDIECIFCIAYCLKFMRRAKVSFRRS